MTWDERDNVLDGAQLVTSENTANALSMLLSRLMAKNGDLAYSGTRTYLALGAGQGVGELQFARNMGIILDEGHITFLDKNLPPDTNKTAPLRRGVKETMSSFLAKPPETHYDLVTAFGMEYVINEQSIGSVLEALEPHLNIGAYIVITPYAGNAITRPGFEYYNPYLHADIVTGFRPVFYKYTGRLEQ